MRLDILAIFPTIFTLSICFCAEGMGYLFILFFLMSGDYVIYCFVILFIGLYKFCFLFAILCLFVSNIISFFGVYFHHVSSGFNFHFVILFHSI